MQVDVNKLFVFKSLLTRARNVLPLQLKQFEFFTKGDGIKSRLPFKIFSTLYVQTKLFQNPKIAPSNVDVVPKLELNHTTRSDVTVSSISK